MNFIHRNDIFVNFPLQKTAYIWRHKNYVNLIYFSDGLYMTSKFCKSRTKHWLKPHQHKISWSYRRLKRFTDFEAPWKGLSYVWIWDVNLDINIDFWRQLPIRNQALQLTSNPKSMLSGKFYLAYIERVVIKIKQCLWTFYGFCGWKNAFWSCKFETTNFIYLRNKICRSRHGQKATFNDKIVMREICLTLRSSFCSVIW